MFDNNCWSLGGGSADPNLNVQLATVIRKAKDQDVPKDNIERAIERVRSPMVLEFEGYLSNCTRPMARIRRVKL